VKLGNVLTDIIIYSSLVAAVMLMTKNANGANLVDKGTAGYANIILAETGQG
jgi:hypothetical protein